MLALPHTNSWGFVYTNQANGSTTPGTAVTPGASDVEGGWTEIAGDASITTDIHYVVMCVHGGVSATAAKNHLLDFAWDAAGGTTYAEVLFQNLVCGNSGNFAANAASGRGGKWVHFPCMIPAGSAIAVRVQGSNATAGSVSVLAWFYGKPSRPELWRPAAYSETIGYSAGSLGTSFTPGNAGWGTWTSLGTTTKKAFWVQAGIQVDNATQSTHALHYQVGVGDGTNMHVIIDGHFATSNSESNNTDMQNPCAWEVPAGATLYIRGNNSAAPVTGYNATAVLFGG